MIQRWPTCSGEYIPILFFLGKGYWQNILQNPGEMSNPLELACGEIPVSFLECKEPFELLDDKEKLYAHFLSKASWAGAPIVLQQVSEESPDIFQLFINLFRGISPDELKYGTTFSPREPRTASYEHWIGLRVAFPMRTGIT